MPILAVLLFLLHVSFPTIVATAWHLLHGDSITYKTWEVPVPKGWYAASKGEMLIVTRMARFRERGNGPNIALLSLPIPAGSAPTSHRLKRAEIEVFSKNGYVFTGGRAIRLGNHEGYCLEFVRRDNRDYIRITCKVLTDQLGVDFEGYRTFVADFYSVLQGVSPASGGR